MKSITLIVTTLVALTLLVSACAPAATAMPAATQAPAATVAMPTAAMSTQAPAATAMAPATQAATATSVASAMTGPATVNVGKNSKYSSFLVDGKRMTLYLFTKDSPGTSTCTGNCTTSWPPLLTNGTPVAGTGVDSTKFGTTTRADGTTQVTYNGWPLYYFAKDQQPGDSTGDGVGSVWYLITPAGSKAVSGG
jgi:predicted lipoprotein with Yx(FWY)xxD motif